MDAISLPVMTASQALDRLASHIDDAPGRGRIDLHPLMEQWGVPDDEQEHSMNALAVTLNLVYRGVDKRASIDPLGSIWHLVDCGTRREAARVIRQAAELASAGQR